MNALCQGYLSACHFGNAYSVSPALLLGLSMLSLSTCVSIYSFCPFENTISCIRLHFKFNLLHSLATWYVPSCKLRQTIHFPNRQWTVIICFPTTGFVLVVFCSMRVTMFWWGKRGSDCLLRPVPPSGGIEQMSTYLWKAISRRGKKSQENSFMLKLQNDNVWMPLRGEVSWVILRSSLEWVVLDIHLFIFSMQQHEQNVARVCVCVCMSGTD